MRLIDADALINKLDEMISNAILADTEIHYALIRELVAEQPTIEPRVRHGRWIEESANEYYCSYCGKYAPIAKNMRHCDCSKWCKECGTKMDEGADNG